MTNTHMMAISSPLTNIHQYRSLVETFPRLEEDEERSLAERYRLQNNLDAAWRLVTSHLRYVVDIARGYAGYGLPQEDLIQEGNVGLMKAVQRFDPSRGVRLVTYATYWIRACIHDFILKNWRIVKVTTTKARRKLFYKLRSAKSRLDWLNRAEAEEIAQALSVTPDDVIDMETRLYLPDEPIDGSTKAGDANRAMPLYLEDTRFDPGTFVAEREFMNTATAELRAAMDTLDARSREILESRWLADETETPTLQELGDRYGISAERVRQLEVAAIKRLRKVMMLRLGHDGSEVA